MRSIHLKRAFSKEDVLSAYAAPLTLRGFRVDHPELINLERGSISDEWMGVIQEMPGRVPNSNTQLTGYVFHVKQAWQLITTLQETGVPFGPAVVPAGGSFMLQLASVAGDTAPASLCWEAAWAER